MCCQGVGMFFFFQAEDGIRDLVRSRGLGDVYKRQVAGGGEPFFRGRLQGADGGGKIFRRQWFRQAGFHLSLIHI